MLDHSSLSPGISQAWVKYVSPGEIGADDTSGSSPEHYHGFCCIAKLVGSMMIWDFLPLLSWGEVSSADKVGPVWNKFSAIASQPNWNFHSSHLYFILVHWNSLKCSGEGWACKFWKDLLLLPRNNTYQNKPNKCDPRCRQPSVKPADLSHLCVFFLSAKSLTIMQSSSIPLHQSIFYWQRWNCNPPGRDASVLWKTEGFQGESPKMETSWVKENVPKATTAAMVHR